MFKILPHLLIFEINTVVFEKIERRIIYLTLPMINENTFHSFKTLKYIKA